MKNIPIPQQPKNREDELYKVIAEFLNKGDNKVFAIDLDVTEVAISQVVNGVTQSKRIWTHIMKTVIKRIEQKKQFLQYAGDTR